jgi:hypothetical protein
MFPASDKTPGRLGVLSGLGLAADHYEHSMFAAA